MTTTQGSSLFAIDIENTLGCNPANVPLCHITRVTRQLRRHLTQGPDDTVIIGCNPAIANAVRKGWPGAEVRTRSGPNGADIELDLALTIDALRRHNLLILCSGDGYLCQSALRARRVGLTVVNLSCPQQRHHRYRQLAHRLVNLTVLPVTPQAA